MVDHFRAAGGAFTLASTHLTALKIYGASTKTVLNASMGFDEETLAPTYQLQVGLPGKSAGLDIAARLGMPEDILRRARASLGQRDLELSRLIADLHRRMEETGALHEGPEKGARSPCCTRKANDGRVGAQGKKPNSQSWKPASTKCSAARQETRRIETVACITESADRRKSVDPSPTPDCRNSAARCGRIAGSPPVSAKNRGLQLPSSSPRGRQPASASKASATSRA